MSPAVPTVVSYPGVMSHAIQCALAHLEAGELQAFATTLAFHRDDRLMRFLAQRTAPAAQALLRELRRREITELPAGVLARHPLREGLRTVAARAGAAASLVDRLWDSASRRFDEAVARRWVPRCRRIHAFEYTALASFVRARALGVQTVLQLPSLDSLDYERQLHAEFERHPQLREPDQPYFAARFGRRYERRQREIALADVLVANSRLTAATHIAAGAPAERVRVVPLAGPAPAARIHYGDPDRPLTVISASGTSFRKGVHYLFEAWRALAAGRHAQVWLYGGLRLPQGLQGQIPAGMEFRGAVGQPELFAAMAQADVLVFPTLSDGFGMVVSEALALGVPVITTDRAGAADRIQHGRNGFVIPAGDAAALRDALGWCLDNRVALAAMREAAWRSAADWQWSDYRAALRKAVALP